MARCKKARLGVKYSAPGDQELNKNPGQAFSKMLIYEKPYLEC